MDEIARSLQEMPLQAAVVWCIGINIGLFILAIAFGELFVRLFRHRRITPPAAMLTWTEILLSISCVALNSIVMIIGVVLYKAGTVEILTNGPAWRVVLDVIVLLSVMDVAMYLLHRIAHIPGIYAVVHQTHHSYENPRPLTLFVLNPFEVLGFGSLWLLVISLYSSTAMGMTIYLALNLAFGTIGHLGVEPLPRRWNQSWTWWISTSTFHAGHHTSLETNFGFYTLIWDYLLGTLDAEAQD